MYGHRQPLSCYVYPRQTQAICGIRLDVSCGHRRTMIVREVQASFGHFIHSLTMSVVIQGQHSIRVSIARSASPARSTKLPCTFGHRSPRGRVVDRDVIISQGAQTNSSTFPSGSGFIRKRSVPYSVHVRFSTPLPLSSVNVRAETRLRHGILRMFNVTVVDLIQPSSLPLPFPHLRLRLPSQPACPIM